MIDEEQRWGKTLYVGFSPNHPNEYYLDNKERIQEILGELNSGYQQLTESLPKADKMAAGGRYFQIPLEEEFLSSFKLGNWRPVEEIHLNYNQPIQFGLDQVVYQVEKASKILNLWENKSRETWGRYRQATSYEDRDNRTLNLFPEPDLPGLKELIDNYEGKTISNHKNKALNLRFKFEPKKDDDYLTSPQTLMDYLSEMKAQFQELIALFPKPSAMILHDNSGRTLPITCFDDLLRARIKEKYIPDKEIMLQFQEPVLGSTKVTYELGYLKLLRWWEQVKGEQRCSSCPNYVPFHSGDSVWCSNPLGDVDAHCNKNKSMQTNPCKHYEGDLSNKFPSVESILNQFLV